MPSAREMLTPILPRIPVGKPGARVISVHVSPPSVDLNNPLSSPPEDKLHGVRKASQMAANITCGLVGLIARSTAPALLLRNKTFFQDLPPSVDLNTPRSAFRAGCP